MLVNHLHIVIMQRLLCLLLICLCLEVENARGDVDDAGWRFFRATEGLPESWCFNVSVGPGGRIWVSHGSTRYNSWFDGWPDEDGKIAHKILSPGYALKMKESKYGQLWSMVPEGFKLFADGSWHLTEYPMGHISDAMTYPIFRVPFIPGEYNQVYFLLADSLCLFDISSRQETRIVRASEAGIGKFIDMSAVRDGGIRITGQNGILMYDPDSSETPARWNVYRPPWPKYRQIKAQATQETGALFLTALNSRDGTVDLLAFDKGNWSIIDEKSDSIVKGWPGLDNSYWLLKTDMQIYHIKNGGSRERLSRGISVGQVFDVACQNDGVFWAATDYGLVRYSPPLWRAPFGPNSTDINVSAICEDESGRIWFMAKEHLHVYDNENWKTYAVPDTYILPIQQAKTLFPVLGNKIGFRSHGGFAPVIFDPESEKFRDIPYTDPLDPHSNRVVHGICPAGGDRYWYITYNAQDSVVQRLEFYDGERIRVKALFPAAFDCRVLCTSANGEVWIGSPYRDYGIGVVRSGRYHTVGPEEGYTGGGVFCSHEFEDGRIWTGGRDEIYEYDGNRWSLVRRGGMDNIYSICSSNDGSVWVASVTGIHRYINGIWFTYGPEEGLPGTAANCVFEDSRGRVWAGTTEGICMFHPEADIDPPEVFFLERDKFTEVPPSGNTRITFSAVDRWNFTDSEKLYFSYRLDNGEWSTFEPGNTAWYSNLSHGSHSFEVRAMDLNLNFSPYPAKLNFTVLLPWYKETAFIVIMIISGTIILVSLGFALHHHFMVESLVIQRTDDLRLTNIRLLRSLRHEKLLADIASSFSTRNGFYENIEAFLELLYDGLEISGVQLFEINDEGNFRSLGNRYAGDPDPGTPDVLLPAGDLLADRFAGILERNNYYISSLNGLPDKDRKIFLDKNIRSVSILPVRTTERAIGVLCFCRSDEHEWSGEEQELFTTITGMLANIWERHNHLQARLAAERKQTEALQVVEKASRMASIGVISAGIAHEINQPLNDISLITDSILFWNKQNRGLIPPKYRAWLQSISDRVYRITEIIRQMRSYWGTPANTMDEEVNLNLAVREAVSLVGTQLASHKIKLEIVENDGELVLKGNKTYLEQIVLNLVVNAMHALDTVEQRDKRITIIISRRDRYITMEVRDNGPGLPEVEANKLFDPFFTTKGSDQGMGLGLAIVKRFVEKYCGKVKAGRGETGGASFLVEFPVHTRSRSE